MDGPVGIANPSSMNLETAYAYATARAVPPLEPDGEPRYNCPFPPCEKQFSKRFNLKAHLRVHTGDKPFACSFPGCTRRFMWKSSLTSHQTGHTRRKAELAKRSASAMTSQRYPVWGSSSQHPAHPNSPADPQTSVYQSRRLQLTHHSPNQRLPGAHHPRDPHASMAYAAAHSRTDPVSRPHIPRYPTASVPPHHSNPQSRHHFPSNSHPFHHVTPHSQTNPSSDDATNPIPRYHKPPPPQTFPSPYLQSLHYSQHPPPPTDQLIRPPHRPLSPRHNHSHNPTISADNDDALDSMQDISRSDVRLKPLSPSPLRTSPPPLPPAPTPPPAASPPAPTPPAPTSIKSSKRESLLSRSKPTTPGSAGGLLGSTSSLLPSPSVSLGMPRSPNAFSQQFLNPGHSPTWANTPTGPSGTGGMRAHTPTRTSGMDMQMASLNSDAPGIGGGELSPLPAELPVSPGVASPVPPPMLPQVQNGNRRRINRCIKPPLGAPNLSSSAGTLLPPLANIAPKNPPTHIDLGGLGDDEPSSSLPALGSPHTELSPLPFASPIFGTNNTPTSPMKPYSPFSAGINSATFKIKPTW